MIDSDLAIKIAEGALALKILGPTAEYIGQQLQEYSEQRAKNFAQIIEKAKEKLGSRINEDHLSLQGSSRRS